MSDRPLATVAVVNTEPRNDADALNAPKSEPVAVKFDRKLLTLAAPEVEAEAVPLPLREIEAVPAALAERVVVTLSATSDTIPMGEGSPFETTSLSPTLKTVEMAVEFEAVPDTLPEADKNSCTSVRVAPVIPNNAAASVNPRNGRVTTEVVNERVVVWQIPVGHTFAPTAAEAKPGAQAINAAAVNPTLVVLSIMTCLSPVP
jgi:hypothetical protein